MILLRRLHSDRFMLQRILLLQVLTSYLIQLILLH